MSTTIFPDEQDHGFHIASRQLRTDCEECQALPRWPVKKIGYLTRNPFGMWEPHGWEFDTSVPDTYPWLIGDMVRMAEQQREIANLPEYQPEQETTS